jgi:signal transduction histidine kinase
MEWAIDLFGPAHMLHKSAYLRIIFFGIIGTLLLSLISVLCLAQISDMVVENFRYGYMMFIGKKIEKTALHRPVEKINLNKYSQPPLPDKETLSLIKLTETPVTQKFPKPSLWLVSSEGEVISSNVISQLPIGWPKLPRPQKPHILEHTENFFLSPKAYVLKLKTIPETYLITYNERSLFQGPFLWVQGLHTFTTAALAVILALSLCFYYLRRKSTEARCVLGKLEAGDLKARFEIRRFDQFGSLILDFNRMADEIERLVKRIHDTESSRSNLLQELGHDLRTPLTSLSTTIETLKNFNKQMSEEEMEDLFSMIESDINYFRDLLDNLTIIATIDEAHYKVSSVNIDLAKFLEGEIKNRAISSNKKLKWSFSNEKWRAFHILGDNHLISRLFKNALDNAARYARNEINLNVKLNEDEVEVTISDDGPGLSTEALKLFGKRRERRELRNYGPRNFSLGLGSVIMKTIAEVHDANLSISNMPKGGACLKISFKVSLDHSKTNTSH